MIEKKTGKMTKRNLTKGTSIKPRPLGVIRDITEHVKYETRLLALHTHALQLSSAKEIGTIVKYTLDAMEFTLGFEHAYFLLVENDSLQIKGSIGGPAAYSAQPLDGRGVTVKAANIKTTLRISDTRKEPAFVDPKGYDWTGPPSVLSELVVPVLIDAEAVAVLCVDSTRPDDFTDDDQRLLETLAIHVGSALGRLRHGGELRESEERYRSVFESSVDAILLTSPDGSILAANPAACRILGRTEEELREVGRDGIVDRSDPRFRYLQEERARTSRFTGELTFKRKDGTRFPAELTTGLFKNRDGLEKTSMIIRDITERKKSEDEIRDLARFPSENPNPLLRLNKNGAILTANPASKLLLQEWGSGIGQVAPKFWRDLAADALSTRQDKNVDAEFGDRYYTFLVKPIVESDYVNLYGRDITKRKLSEEALRESEERYRVMFENMGSGMAIYGAVDDGKDFIFKGFNRAAERIDRIEREKLIGRSVLEIFPGVRDFGLFDVFQRVWRTGNPEHHPTALYKDNRVSGWRENYVYRLSSGEIVAVYEDITERKRMDEMLRESEEKYRGLVENSLNFIGILQDGILKYVNRTAVERFGWTYDELVSPSFDPIEKVVAARFRGLIKENVGKRLREEDAPPYEISLTTRDGSEIPVIVRAAKIVYQGRPAVEFTFSDITERKRMEEELSKSSQFLGSVIENAYVWLNVLDNEQNVLVWNKAAEAMSGYSREEVVGHGKIWECLYPDQEYRKQITETVTDVLQSGRTDVDVETKIRRKDGQTRIISWNERALTDQDGKVIGTIAIGHDITELKQMQHELQRYSKHLQESEEKLRALHQHALQLSSASNINRIIEHTLDAMEFALGFDVADFYLLEGDFLRVKGTRGNPLGLSEEHIDGRGLVATAARSKASGRVSDTSKESDYVDRKGYDWKTAPTMFSELAVPVIVHGETTAVLNVENVRLGAFSDEDQRLLETLAAHVGSEMQRLKHGQELETYSKHLEELVEERTKKLRAAERLAAVGETAAMVGHDLRNPLQGIAGALYLLKQESLTARERNEMLQLIQDNVEYSDAIVRDLSDYSAEIQLKLVETTLKSITRGAIQAVKVPEKVTVQDLSEDYPAFRVDPDRMRRVFINLIENAIEAMPQGGTLTISSKQSNGSVEIALSDTGSGVPKKVMENLWKPLQTTKAKGLGLGLAICKRITDAHGGTINVKSKTGEGTTVTIRLPIKPDAVEVKQK
ncbi:MAG: PAS domain S-box protein [Candidatus Bathyarchaeia archaeon]